MEVILLERVEKLGAIGDVVKVKDGFARNYPAAQQEGASRQRGQPQAVRSQPRQDRGRQCRPPRRGREGVEGRRRQDRPADPPGVEHRPALRFGQRPRHRRGAGRRRRQGDQEPDRPRPADQGDRHARGQGRASPGGDGDGQGQCRPLARGSRSAGPGRRRHGADVRDATPRRCSKASSRLRRTKRPRTRNRKLPKLRLNPLPKLRPNRLPKLRPNPLKKLRPNRSRNRCRGSRSPGRRSQGRISLRHRYATRKNWPSVTLAGGPFFAPSRSSNSNGRLGTRKAGPRFSIGASGGV